MFTGLIEEIGRVKNINFSNEGAQLIVACSKILENIKQGDSVSVNGACQTVVDFGKDYFKSQLSNETLAVTNFSLLKEGARVNLERAMTLSSRFDGHFVNGHIDCTAVFLRKIHDGFSQRLFFEITPEYGKYLVNKASITINGVSLTMASVEGKVFSVEAIPKTMEDTILQDLKTSEKVNIEIDIISKYVEKFLSLNNNNTSSKVTESFLKENGFI